jgi:hypothetical protein
MATYGFDTPHAIVGIAGAERVIDGVGVSQDRVSRLRLPDAFTAEQVTRIGKDFAILTDAANQRADEFQGLLNAALRGDSSAPQRARDLGLTEDQMQQQGGGVILAVIVIAVACALLLESDSPPPPPPPPPASDGGADAGTG